MQNRAGATCDFTDGRLVIEGAFPAVREADRQFSPAATRFREVPARASARTSEVDKAVPPGCANTPAGP